jgi:hypothetical protein
VDRIRDVVRQSRPDSSQSLRNPSISASSNIHDGIRCPPALPSIAWAGGCLAGERDDAAGVGVAELLVFQGELADSADQGGDVGAEPGLVLVVRARCP